MVHVDKQKELEKLRREIIEKVLNKSFPEKKEKIYRIPHYSIRRTRTYEKRKQEFKNELNKIKEIYSKLRNH